MFILQKQTDSQKISVDTCVLNCPRKWPPDLDFSSDAEIFDNILYIFKYLKIYLWPWCTVAPTTLLPWHWTLCSSFRQSARQTGSARSVRCMAMRALPRPNRNNHPVDTNLKEMEWTGEIARLPNSFLHECVATWVNLRLVWLKSRAPPSLLSFFQVVASALKMGSDMTCALLHPSCTSQVALDNLGWVRFAPTLAAFLSCLYLKS